MPFVHKFDTMLSKSKQVWKKKILKDIERQKRFHSDPLGVSRTNSDTMKNEKKSNFTQNEQVHYALHLHLQMPLNLNFTL